MLPLFGEAQETGVKYVGDKDRLASPKEAYFPVARGPPSMAANAAGTGVIWEWQLYPSTDS